MAIELNPTGAKIEVEIWSDFVCPFCYIGKRAFETALAGFAGRDDVHVTYKSFELDPSALKSQSVGIDQWLAKRYGRGVEWARQMNQQVADMAAGVGLTYAVGRWIPTNSFDAHRLAHFAFGKGRAEVIVEKLFAAYFTQARDLAEHDVLLAIARDVGLEADEVSEMLASKAYADDVRADEEEARGGGIQGVPFFLFNRKFALSGAQPIDVFTQALERAAQA